MKEKQIDKNKVILILAVVLIVTGIVFLFSGIDNLNKLKKFDTFFGLEPIKTGISTTSNRNEEYADIFSIVVGELGENVNPIFATMHGEKVVSELIFEPLFKRDATGQMKRVLADNISYLDEEKSILVSIKDDVLFSDGSLMYVEDVYNAILFSALQDGAGTGNIVGLNAFKYDPSRGLEGLEQVGDNQIKITFSRYDIDNDLILETLVPKSSHIEWTFDKNILEQVQQYLGDGIGTNSYQLVEKQGKYITLAENTYYREENNGIKGVVVYHESAVDFDEFIDDQILDMVNFHRESGYYNSIYNNDNIDIYSNETLGTLGIFFDMQGEFMQNDALREAVYIGINRDALVSELDELKDFIPVSSMFPTTGFTSGLHTTTANTQKAIELVEQAKTELGLEKITMYLPVVKDNKIHINVANEVKKQLADIGLNVTVDELSLSSYMDAIYLSQRFSIYISEVDALTNTSAINKFASQYFYDDNLPMDLQMEFVVFASGEEEKISAYEALNTAVKQESSVVPFARTQEFIAFSNYWGDVTILPNKNAPHNLHLLKKK